MLLVPVTAAAPSGITLRFITPVFGGDLTTVTAVNANVLRRDGTTISLPFVIVSATATELVAQHTFAPGDLTTTGIYYLAPALSVGGGVIASETVSMFVGAAFNTSPQLEQEVWITTTVPIPNPGLPTVVVLPLPSQSVSYTPATPGNWASAAPTTVKAALDRLANVVSASGSSPIP